MAQITFRIYAHIFIQKQEYINTYQVNTYAQHVERISQEGRWVFLDQQNQAFYQPKQIQITVTPEKKPKCMNNAHNVIK